MKKEEHYMYPAVFSCKEGQAISVVFPDLDVATSGTDERDALLSAHELLEVALSGLEEDGEPLTAPSSLSDLSLAPYEYVVQISRRK